MICSGLQPFFCPSADGKMGKNIHMSMAADLWAPIQTGRQSVCRILIALAALAAALYAEHTAPIPPLRVYAGGVAGLTDMLDAAGSRQFRAAGGGLYLHNSGWQTLRADQRKKILENFSDCPVMLELGFGRDAGQVKAWAEVLKKDYLDLGVRPVVIASNAFDSNTRPTLEQWLAFAQGLRQAGLAETTKLLPTFEYQNYHLADQLAQNRITLSADFQNLLRAAGGIVIDSPAGYFFSREQAYRDWVVDAIRWSHSQQLYALVIVSPHTSADQYSEDAERFVRYLCEHDAVPDAFSVENYNPAAGPDWPNRVGREDQPDSQLGVAWFLLGDLLPRLLQPESKANDSTGQ